MGNLTFQVEIIIKKDRRFLTPSVKNRNKKEAPLERVILNGEFKISTKCKHRI